LFGISQAYYNIQKFEKGLEVTKKLLLLNRNIPKLLAPDGYAHITLQAAALSFELEAYQSAEHLYTEAIHAVDESHPLHWKGRTLRACLYKFFGQTDRAITELEACIQFLKVQALSSTAFHNIRVKALIGLATCLLDRKQAAEGKQYADEAYRIAVGVLESGVWRGHEDEAQQVELNVITAAEIFAIAACADGDANKALEYLRYTEPLRLKRTPKRISLGLGVTKAIIAAEQGSDPNVLLSLEKLYENEQLNKREEPILAVIIATLLFQHRLFSQAACWFRKSISACEKLEGKLSKDEWSIALLSREIDAYKFLEVALFLDQKPLEALIASDSRRARALVRTLQQKVDATGIAIPEPSLETMRSLAKERHTTLVVYSEFTKEAPYGFCWVVKPCGTVVCRSMPMRSVIPEDITNLVSELPSRSGEEPSAPLPGADSYHAFNQLDSNGSLETSDPDLEKSSECNLKRHRAEAAARQAKRVGDDFREKLRKWYDVLIEPIEDLLPGSGSDECITFVPDGSMSILPFALFERKDGTHIIERHPCVTTPSVQVAYLLHLLEKSKGSGEGIAIAGNPTSPLVDGLLTAEEEACEVGKFFDVPPLIGQEASAEAFLSSIKKARYIHSACHGTFEGSKEEYSLYEGALYFSQDDAHEDGRLFAAEIAELDLQADVATISACYSARGNVAYLHEGLIGMTRAFLSAGVTTVAASLWKVPDTTQTIEMMKEFYRHVTSSEEAGCNRAKAHQIAVRHVIEANRGAPQSHRCNSRVRSVTRIASAHIPNVQEMMCSQSQFPLRSRREPFPSLPRLYIYDPLFHLP
jgi:CHAT domain-containing protein